MTEGRGDTQQKGDTQQANATQQERGAQQASTTPQAQATQAQASTTPHASATPHPTPMDKTKFFAALDTLLNIHACNQIDVALNGLQVGRANAEITRVTTAVDASVETIQRAVEAGSDCMIVHHGIFWGGIKAIVGGHRARIAALLSADCALYAAHLPLDIHPTLGNNALIAKHLGLTAIEPFGIYRGTAIGCCGALPAPQSVEEITETLLRKDSARPLATLPFGKARCARIGIVSGGGAFAVAEAIERGLDTLIIGDTNHTIYYEAQEGGLNVLCAGHYNTEVWGVRALATHTQQKFGIEAKFLDMPTGL